MVVVTLSSGVSAFEKINPIRMCTVRQNAVPVEQPLLPYNHRHTQSRVWRMELASRKMLQCFQDYVSIHEEVHHSHYKVFRCAQTEPCMWHWEWNSCSSKVPWKTKTKQKNYLKQGDKITGVKECKKEDKVKDTKLLLSESEWSLSTSLLQVTVFTEFFYYYSRKC